MWLSHHHVGEADRCVQVASTHVCRRCLAMFAGFVPAVFVLAFTSYVAQVADIAVVVGMTTFAAYEFVQVVRGVRAYRARRVLVVSPFVGGVLAWLGVTGLADGLGPAHIGLGLVGLALLGVLLANGTLVRASGSSS